MLGPWVRVPAGSQKSSPFGGFFHQSCDSRSTLWLHDDKIVKLDQRFIYIIANSPQQLLLIIGAYCSNTCCTSSSFCHLSRKTNLNFMKKVIYIMALGGFGIVTTEFDVIGIMPAYIRLYHSCASWYMKQGLIKLSIKNRKKDTSCFLLRKPCWQSLFRFLWNVIFQSQPFSYKSPRMRSLLPTSS